MNLTTTRATSVPGIQLSASERVKTGPYYVKLRNQSEHCALLCIGTLKGLRNLMLMKRSKFWV